MGEGEKVRFEAVEGEMSFFFFGSRLFVLFWLGMRYNADDCFEGGDYVWGQG